MRIDIKFHCTDSDFQDNYNNLYQYNHGGAFSIESVFVRIILGKE